MEPTPSSGVGSGNSATTYSPEISDTLLFGEEIQSLAFGSPPVTGSSFTALLGLAPSQAAELLHNPEPPPLPPPPVLSSADADSWRFAPPLGCTPTFPSNAALVDRAARFSVFAAEKSPEAAGSISGDLKLKAEPADSGDRPAFKRLTGKRKEAGEKSKVIAPAKKSKSGEENGTGGDDKLPYVHVRARRGQATDSHSLAERARREKINARMKLLQELVPGCNKISGTALVLDEIINHVQTLQRQVEFLSMRLAAVNPTSVDYNGLNTILSSECVRLMAGSSWSMTDGTTNGDGQAQQQIWHDDMVQQQQQWGRDETENRQQHLHVFVGQPGSLLFPSYDSTSGDEFTSKLFNLMKVAKSPSVGHR